MAEVVFLGRDARTRHFITVRCRGRESYLFQFGSMPDAPTVDLYHDDVVRLRDYLSENIAATEAVRNTERERE